MNRKLIGLCGFAGSGKDTVADHLVAQHGFTKLAFADQLRDEICDAWGVSEQMLLERKTKTVPLHHLALAYCRDNEFVMWLRGTSESRQEWQELNPMTITAKPRSPRWLMQQWGDFRRAMNPRYFLNAMSDRLEALPGRDVVISDVRQTPEPYRNSEAQFVLIRNGQLWNITRQSSTSDTHATEQEFDAKLITYQIANDSTVTALHRMANYCISNVEA